MKIVHLSDLHYHRNPDDNQEADAVVEYVKKHYPDHIVVVTGDITDDGHEQQYANAYSALKGFKRIFIAPGNHDFGAVGFLYNRERAKRFDDLSMKLNQGGTFFGVNKPVVNVVNEEGEGVMFIALDSNLETDSPFDIACGEIGSSQLEDLHSLLNSPASYAMKKVLFFHHHPFAHNDPTMYLRDSRELARVIFNRVDLVLFGHKHVMNRWKNIFGGAQYICASDNSPGKDYAHEITIQNGKVTAAYIPISPKGKREGTHP